MHELSLAGGVLALVEQAAQREGFRRVERLALEAGALSGVEVRALRFAIDALAPGTCLAGATIDIAEPPGRAWCMPCGENVPLAVRGDACPRCGGYQLQVVSGTDLRVVDLLVHDD